MNLSNVMQEGIVVQPTVSSFCMNISVPESVTAIPRKEGNF